MPVDGSGGSRWRWCCSHFLGEVFGIRIGDDAVGLIAEGELGVAKECVVGGGDEAAGHLQDGVGGSGLDPGGQFLGFGFQFGGQRLGHRNLWRKEIRTVTLNYTEVNTFRTNFRDAYPSRVGLANFSGRRQGWILE